MTDPTTPTASRHRDVPGGYFDHLLAIDVLQQLPANGWPIDLTALGMRLHTLSSGDILDALTLLQRQGKVTLAADHSTVARILPGAPAPSDLRNLADRVDRARGRVERAYNADESDVQAVWAVLPGLLDAVAELTAAVLR